MIEYNLRGRVCKAGIYFVVWARILSDFLLSPLRGLPAHSLSCLVSPPLKNLVPSLSFSLPIFLIFSQFGACVKDTKKIITTPSLDCC